jgi:hypothetical protein
MSKDRSVSTDALETLGNIIDANQGRDAIHLAVEPVEANQWLRPGQHVGRLENGRFGPDAEKTLGVVDPFIGTGVAPGQWFWLLLYPRQITSLRHVWTHPDFPDNTDSAAVEYLKAFAIRAHTTYDELLKGLEECADSGEPICLGTTTPDYDHEEMWRAYIAVTGHRPSHTPDYIFRCAC